MKPLSIALWAVAVIAIVSAVAVIIFFAWTLNLRTDYKETCQEINDVLRVHQEDSYIGQGDTKVLADSAVVNWYDIFLLDANTSVYSRKEAETDEKTIYLQSGECTLSFTGYEDGSSIQVLWITPEERKAFRVRSLTTFYQLEAYYKNYLRKAG